MPGASKTSRLGDAAVYRIRYHNDPEFQIRERIRRQVTKRRKRDGIGDVMRSAIQSGGKSKTVENKLGYTIADLKQHIERQFAAGMNWDLFLAGRIHIDHIIPQAAFDTRDDDEWKACWSLTNLQPLWASDNLKKHSEVQNLI